MSIRYFVSLLAEYRRLRGERPWSNSQQVVGQATRPNTFFNGLIKPHGISNVDVTRAVAHLRGWQSVRRFNLFKKALASIPLSP